ncbi:hypothetical protein ES332_A01G197200v1 [Gossypium tomentosum]|uniref:Uncharacterized protein n=1 Tax=Gossypium tomentosum TaxID=34277 RepID=A0A5D2RSM6_GOSTO|nr:hypothetical protein ES332_A01G197200v1 [Gossypium tomentosum]
MFSPLWVLCSAKFASIPIGFGFNEGEPRRPTNQSDSVILLLVYSICRTGRTQAQAETRVRGWWRMCATHSNCWLLREREKP